MPDLKELIDLLRDFLHENWLKMATGALLMGVGWFFGRRRARNDWKNKEFLHRLNVSLNVIQPGQPLRIRTLIEKPCSEVFLNAVAVDAVTRAARRTTEQMPLLPLPKEDYWHYLNAVLNEVSEQFAQGQVRREMGLPVTCRHYVMALTCECAGEMRTRKIRAMLVAKEILLKLGDKPPAFEHPTHLTRWETLKTMAREYAARPWQFLEVELCQ